MHGYSSFCAMLLDAVWSTRGPQGEIRAAARNGVLVTGTAYIYIYIYIYYCTHRLYYAYDACTYESHMSIH